LSCYITLAFLVFCSCSIYPDGCVTTLHSRDLPALKKALSIPLETLSTPAAGLAPEYETVELLSAQFPELSLEQLLRKLDAEARLDGRYFLCNQEQLLETARVLGKVRCELGSSMFCHSARLAAAGEAFCCLLLRLSWDGR
jgi:hypothetical protein